MEQGYDVWAHDGSAEMVGYCRRFLGERVEQATFEEYSTERRFDALWACASLLHVKRELLPEILKKYSEVLKRGGIFFMSFKNRESDLEKDGRIFTNFNEKTITELLKNIEELELVKVIYTADIRKDRQEEGWISIIAKKSCV